MLWGVAVLTSAVLFVLEVIGVIHVSWWLVFAPVLAVLGISLVMVVVALIVFAIGALIVHKADKRVTYSQYKRGRGYGK